jgi:hypothetical protein
MAKKLEHKETYYQEQLRRLSEKVTASEAEKQGLLY